MSDRFPKYDTHRTYPPDKHPPRAGHRKGGVLYETRDGKIHTRAVEYSVAYHCNLRCSGCSHMSPFIDTKLPPLESETWYYSPGEPSMKHDLQRISRWMQPT